MGVFLRSMSLYVGPCHVRIRTAFYGCWRISWAWDIMYTFYVACWWYVVRRFRYPLLP
jgi:hypothetical protein